jgi:hypothetical protein
MFTNIPSVAFFAILQTVDIIRYLLQRRMELLKTETWKIYDDKNNSGTMTVEISQVEDTNIYFQRKIRSIETRIKMLKLFTSNWSLILFVVIFLIVIFILLREM